jgi:hypothetical protein
MTGDRHNSGALTCCYCGVFVVQYPGQVVVQTPHYKYKLLLSHHCSPQICGVSDAK